MNEELSIEDKIISEFLQSLGPWAKFLTIGGGYAPIIYKIYFSDSEGFAPVKTQDLDTLISRRIPRSDSKSILGHLQEAGFEPDYTGIEHPPAARYRKLLQGIEIEVEFLTDDLSRDNKYKNVSIYGVIAQPLKYLSLSIQKRLAFQTSDKESGFVVAPEAWIFHKGLTFVDRKDHLKCYKDLYGIWYVGSQLQMFSEQALQSLIKLKGENSSWSKKFNLNLRTWAEKATPQDWVKLVGQDPYGTLSKLNFTKLLKKIASD